MARRPERRKRTTAAIAAASKLAGEIRTGATGLDFANQTHWEREREEAKANSFPASERPGRARKARSMAGGHGARRSSSKTVLDTTKLNERSTGRKRGRRRCSPQRKTRQRWLGSTDSRGGRRRRIFFAVLQGVRMSGEGRGEKNGRERSVLGRRSPLLTEAWWRSWARLRLGNRN